VALGPLCRLPFELCLKGEINNPFYWSASNSSRLTIKSALALIKKDAPVGWIALDEMIMTNVHRFKTGLTK